MKTKWTYSDTGAIALGFATVVMLLLVLASARCTPHGPDPVEPPQPGPETTTCAAVCAAWADLSCIEATPTPAGVECVEVCEMNEQWDHACLGAVKSCDQIAACPTD